MKRVGSVLLLTSSLFLCAPRSTHDFGHSIDSIEITNSTIQTVDLNPATCGTNEVWEDQGGAWVCIATPNGAGTSGDSVRVEDGDNTGAFTSMANVDMDDAGDIDFTRAAGPPDVLTAAVRPDSVALTTDTTGGYAASVSEAGPATTATELAANGANCATAGQFPRGVDASGAVESCTNAVGSVKRWRPFAPPSIDNRSDILTVAVVDLCRCHEEELPFVIADLDELYLLEITSDADDHVELGVFSEDGATRYFQAQIDVTSTGYKNVANTIGAPSVMYPGAYWVCTARDNTTPSAQLGRPGPSGVFSIEPTLRFDQACVGGAIPATLTAPSGTFFDATYELWFVAKDL